MEEKVQYQSEERLLDIREHLQSLENKLTAVEHQVFLLISFLSFLSFFLSFFHSFFLFFLSFILSFVLSSFPSKQIKGSYSGKLHELYNIFRRRSSSTSTSRAWTAPTRAPS
jgi:hypothetical protein